MTLPTQIQKQVEEANALIKQRYGSAAEGEDSPSEVAPPADDAEQTPQNAAEGVNPPEGDDVTPPPAPPEDENSQTFAQRWRSLQGVFNATNQQLTSARQRIQQLETVLATMQATAPVSHQVSVDQYNKPHVSEDDVKEYGSEMVDFARRVAREEAAPLAQAFDMMRREIEQLRGVVPVVNSVAATQRMSSRDTYFAQLTSQFPDWRAINESPSFHEWCLTPDPMTGITRQTYLEDAQRGFDVPRTVNIFTQFVREAGGSVAPQPPQAASKPNPAASELQMQVAPGRSTATAGAPPARKDARVWTPESVKNFYRDVTAGKYRGRDAERQELERDLFRADSEGRFVRHAA